MYRVSDRFLAALTASHTVVVRVDAFQGAKMIASDLPVTEGAVNVKTGAGVRRTLDVTLADPGLWDTLAPVGTELRVWRGIQYPGGSREMVPLGVFSLDQQGMPVQAKGAVTISSAPDRWARVQRARFESPRTSQGALTCVQSAVDLVGEAVACTADTAGVGGSANVNAGLKTPVQVWDRDRDKAVTDLCTAAGVEAFFGPLGQLVVRDVPTVGGSPAWRVHGGRDGVLLAANATRDRTRVYNVVVVISSVTSGAVPFQPVICEDNDPLSPTNVNGPYGRCPYMLITSTLGNAADARVAGNAMLTKTKGSFVDVSASAVVNPALEGGDTVSAPTPAGTGLYLLDGFGVPLTSDGTQALTCRSLAVVTGDTSS